MQMVISAMPAHRSWQCLRLLGLQVDPTAVLYFPEEKGNITIIEDTHVEHPRLVYLVGIYTSDSSFT